MTVQGLLRASPDFRGRVDALLSAEDNHVIARVAYTGTDEAGFMRGRPETGKPFAMTAIHVSRAEGDQLKELGQEADMARELRQFSST